MVALGLVAVLLLGISYVYAQEQGNPPGHGWMHGQKHGSQWNKLNLTPEQKVKSKELHRKFVRENAQLIGDLVAKRLELRSLWTDPKAGSQDILVRERELRDLQNQIRDKIVRYKLEVRKFLTPEQIGKFGMMAGIGFGRGFHHRHHRYGCGCHYHWHHGQGMDRPGMGAGKDPSI